MARATRGGRIAIGAFVAIIATCMIVGNLPDKYPAVRRVSGVTHHVVDTVGCRQVWRVFAPPRNEVLALEAVVTFDNGSTARHSMRYPSLTIETQQRRLKAC